MSPAGIVVVASGRGRLHVRVTAASTIADVHLLFAEIAREAATVKATELLIDASVIEEKLSLVARLQVVLSFVTSLRGYRVAAVLSEKTIDPKRIGETMARNRGANVKAFTSLPEAVAWLGWD